MAQALQWLNRASFLNRITLPDGFDLSVFNTALTDLEENELYSILGAERLTELKTWVLANPAGQLSEVGAGDEDTELDVSLLPLYTVVVPFLVYAAYAWYILEGDAQATDTGLVTKERENSEALSDTRIAQLYRSYRDKANVRAGRITTYLQQLESNTCAARQLGYEIRISSSGGRTKSILD